jgi:hypothetical protein
MTYVNIYIHVYESRQEISHMGMDQLILVIYCMKTYIHTLTEVNSFMVIYRYLLKHVGKKSVLWV